MANCDLCNKKLGFGEKNQITLPGLPTFAFCNDCNKKLNEKLKEGDLEAYKEVHSIIDDTNYMGNKKIKALIQRIEKVPDVIQEEKLAAINQKRKEHEVFTEIMASANKTINIPVTTSYNFDGCKITEYKDVVDGTYVIGTGFLSETFAAISDLVGEGSDMFAIKIMEAKKCAMNRMKQVALNTGANAIIGVSFNIVQFQSNMIGVSATGTAVVIEKE